MIKIEVIEEPSDVFDITVEDNHNFYGNGILVHNCSEITLNTEPMGDDDSLIALCTLSALNWGMIKNDAEMAESAELAVRALDALLDYQDYPNIAAKRHTDLYRPLGVGIIGFAHFLAKKGVAWGEDSRALVSSMMEKMAYYLTRTSCDLAKEKGSIPTRTKYHDGIFPFDNAKTEVKLTMAEKWDELREDLKKYGIRNSTLMALMPSECQHWENKLNLADGTTPNFHEICDRIGVDWAMIEEHEYPTQVKISDLEDVQINTRFGPKSIDSLYYNGKKEIYEIEFEDGFVQKFTGNHLLMTHNGWKRVDSLKEEDEIIHV